MEGIKSLNPDSTLDHLNPTVQLRKGLPPYLLTMNEVDREANLRIIQSMNKKITFLKNPRTVPAAPKGRFQSLSASSPFRAEPAEVLFSNYEAGGVYAVEVTLTNVAEVLRRVILLPPATTLFSIGSVQYPTATSGLIAPGMSAVISIHFRAESLADYDDELLIKTEQNTILIPLRARREPPSLSLEERIDCGTAWVGDRSDKSFHVLNTGGSGGFKFFHELEENDPEPGSEMLQTEPFTIFPLEFFLQKGEAIDIFISFQPKNEGQFTNKVILACDNHTSSFYMVQGYGAMVDFSLSRLDGKELDPAADPISGLWFPEAPPGDSKERLLEVRNTSSIQVQFHWSLYPRELQGLQFDAPPAHFAITPGQGTFGPGESLAFKVTFTPDAARPFDEFADLFVEGVPWTAVKQLPEGLLKSLQANEGAGALVGSNSKFPPIPFRQMQLHGLGAVSKVNFSTGFHRAHKAIPIGTSYTLSSVLTNHSLGPVAVALHYEEENSTQGLLAKANFSEAELPVGGSLDVHFDMISTVYGWNTGIFRCDVRHGRPVYFRFEGEMVGPEVRIGESEVDFGLIRTFDEAKFRLHIENLSSIPAPIRFTKAGQEEVSDPRLHIDPPSKVLQAHEQSSVMVSFTGKEVQSVRETLMCIVANGKPQYVQLRAEVQRPLVCLTKYGLDIGELAAGIPKSFSDLALVNFGNLPTQFQWEETADADLTLMFDPARGIVPAHSRTNIEMTIKALKGGPLNRIFMCNVDGLDLPLGIEVTAEVKGLDILYGVADEAALSRVASKRQMESLPPSLYAESERKKYASSVPSPTVEFQPLRALDFGMVHINEVRVLKFLIKNNSGLQAHFVLRSESYEPGISQEEAEEKRVQKEAQATQFSGGTKVKFSFAAKPAQVREEKLPQLLTNAHEKQNKFSSQNGATFTTTRNLEKNQRFYLANNKGMAVVCVPNKGELLPYSEAVVSVTLYNDVCGRFEDVVVSSVSGLKDHKIPLKVRVKGSPLVITPHQLGIDYKSDPFELNLGAIPVGGNAISRKIRLTNTGPKDISVAWKLFNYHDILHNEKDIFKVALLPSAAARFYEGEEHNLLDLLFTPIEPPENHEPFSLEPKSMLLHGRESGTFTITFFSQDTGLHRGVLLTHPLLVEEGESQQLGELALMLRAETIIPSLFVDKLRHPNGLKGLKFEAWATGGPLGTRDITLCNQTSANLQFTIRIESGPFTLKKVNNSASLSLQDPEEAKTMTSKKPTRVPDKHTLAPGDNLQVYIQLIKPNPADTDVWPELPVTELPGSFLVSYSNGHQERLALEARLMRPNIVVWSEQVDEFKQLQEQDFGVVTVDRTRKLTLYLSNETVVDAKWALVYVKTIPKAHLGAKTMTKKETENQSSKDDQEVFQFSTSEGLLQGPSVPVRRCFPGSAFPYIPTDREPAQVVVSFQPKIEALYKSKFRVMVEGGPATDVVLKGRGTYREEVDR